VSIKKLANYAQWKELINTQVCIQTCASCPTTHPPNTPPQSNVLVPLGTLCGFQTPAPTNCNTNINYCSSWDTASTGIFCFLVNYPASGKYNSMHQITPERKSYPDVAFIDRSKEYRSTLG